MIEIRDRLKSRILVDQYLFFLFAAGGSVLIVAAKALASLSMEEIALGAVLVMLVYAVLVGKKGVGKLRADQAGDNCYYLGLIYTLTSLAFAIFTFDPAETANAIVQGFGVALATTIFGLILRVFFNQSRVDIHEIEEDVRQELVEAASRLKTQLNQISNGFSDFSLGLQQSMLEVREAATSGVKDSSERSVEAVRQLAASAGEGLKGQVDQFQEHVAELAKATKTSTRALERHAGSLESLTEQQQNSADGLEAIKETVAAAVTMGEELRAQQRTMAELQESISTVARQLAENSSKLNGATEASIASLTGLATQLKSQLDQFETAPTRNMDAALLAIGRAAERLEESINRVAEQHEDVRRSVQTGSEELVASIAKHNQALDIELEQARAKFSRVGEGLVGVIDELRDQVQARG